MSTTQEDYFGDAVDDGSRRKHRKHRRRHDYPSDDDSDISPGAVVHEHEEREYKKPGRKHRVKETTDTTYVPRSARSDSDSDDAGTDDGGKRRRRRHRHRRREKVSSADAAIVPDPETDTDVDDRSTRSRSPVGLRERSKSVGESALAALGLDETIKNFKERSGSRHRGRKSSVDSDEGYDSERARSRSRMNSNTAQAAILAAAVEAFRARKEPGGVTGKESMKRVVEAALASGAVEKFLGRDGRDNGGNSTRHVAEAVLAGLAAQRGINGPRRKSRSRHGGSSDTMKDLAASGLIAAAGKKLLDMQRSRSQSRGRGYAGERPGFDRKRSHSVGEALAAVGLGGIAADRLSKDRRRRNSDTSSRQIVTVNRNGRQVVYAEDRRDRGSRSGRSDRGIDRGDDRGVDRGDRRRRRNKRPGVRDNDSSSSSSVSDSDLELDEEGERKRHKMLRQKEIIGIALAIIATLHLGHAGYEAKEKRAERREALESGKISEAEAEKMKVKAKFGDIATIGLAVLAAAEAVKSFKEMSKRHHECREFDAKHDKIEERRKQKAIENGSSASGSTTGGEASKYYGTTGYMGPPPGAVAAVPAYPYYPASGPIPVTRAGEAYNTRDGRKIPVVYPSSVTHA